MMLARIQRAEWLLLKALTLGLWGCGAGDDSQSGTKDGSVSTMSSSSTSGNTAESVTSGSGGSLSSMTSSNSASASASSGGSGGTGGIGGETTTSTSGSATGGAANTAMTANTSGGPTSGCSIAAWPEADPAAPGPYDTVTEENVGPLAGEGEDGEPVAFTLFRPQVLGQDGRCHPVITWGNGTGSNPGLYGVLLRHLASHGFVVIASNSPNVANGDPPPMVAGVSWLVEQNQDPTSAFYQQIDVTHVGGTGHSQGGFATSQAGGNEQLTTIAPLCGAATQRNLHGPALLLCGGMDEVVPCSSVENAFNNTNDQPVMLANYVTADHADWVTFRGTDLSPMEVAVVAWMRVQLMGDTALRSWFYGASCGLCTDSAWSISQKMMDE